MTADQALPTRVLLAVSQERPFEVVRSCIAQYYTVQTVDDGWAAAQMLKDHDFRAAIVDADLPGKSGFQVAKHAMDPLQGGTPVPVLLVGRRETDGFATERLEGISDRHIFMPFDDGDFLTAFWDVCDKAAERNWDKLNYTQASVLKVTKKNIQKIFSMAAMDNSVDMSLVHECSNTVVTAAQSGDLDGVLKELRDHHSYTFVHNLKVASLMTIFGSHIGLKQGDLSMLAQGGLLHDIGKFKTPITLLDKPSKLDDEEWQEMRLHPGHAHALLDVQSGVPQEVVHIATRHHEKIDGTGYPMGLKGAQLDDLSLIAAIADVYSALTDKRSYKKSLPLEKTVEIMTSMRGHHLEPGFLDKFLEMVQEGIIT